MGAGIPQGLTFGAEHVKYRSIRNNDVIVAMTIIFAFMLKIYLRIIFIDQPINSKLQQVLCSDWVAKILEVFYLVYKKQTKVGCVM